MSSDGRSGAVLDEVASAQKFADPLGSSGAEARVAARGAQVRVARSAAGAAEAHDHWRLIPWREACTLFARLRIGPILLQTCCRAFADGA
jgi:hypothetical protein